MSDCKSLSRTLLLDSLNAHEKKSIKVQSTAALYLLDMDAEVTLMSFAATGSRLSSSSLAHLSEDKLTVRISVLVYFLRFICTPTRGFNTCKSKVMFCPLERARLALTDLFELHELVRHCA